MWKYLVRLDLSVLPRSPRRLLPPLAGRGQPLLDGRQRGFLLKYMRGNKGFLCLPRLKEAFKHVKVTWSKFLFVRCARADFFSGRFGGSSLSFPGYDLS